MKFNKIITCGEGGIVIVDDEKLFKRALMFHDVVRRPDVPFEERIQGLNLKVCNQ